MTLRRPLVALTLAALVLTACGQTDRDDGPGSTAPAADDAFPVVLESEFGTTEITAEPERVVVLGLIDADPVLALGVTPVALQQWLPQFDDYGVGPWAQDLVAEAVDSGETTVLPNPGVVQVDVEQVAALAPDLVVAVSANVDQQTFDQLSALAPVVARPVGTVNFGVPMAESTMLIGRALGREEQAAELVERTEQAYADAAAAHPEFAGATAALARPVEGGWSVWQSADVRVQIATSLGLTRPAGLADIDDGAFAQTLSPERLDLLEADVLVVVLPEGFGTAVEDDAVLGTLDVVQRGDAVVLDASDVGGALAYGSALSATTVVEEVVPQLSAALTD